ncbi:hypothetical protein E4U56_002298 [Claviceps arundinis]|uniref:Uncharacterized protein n=1 Tax=Claviceps arundinis TaxID=1623583 RepID=A0A9P7SNX5_9HYPO|nr:hypothetical protein E4U56_002298 [Claviceps arundinis]
MQLLSAILVAFTASGAAANIPATTLKSTSTGINNGPDLYPRWCNHGTQGNGGCEANGRNTYCIDTHVRTSADVHGSRATQCSDVQTSYFEVFRMTTVASENKDGVSSCENNGVIWCS